MLTETLNAEKNARPRWLDPQPLGMRLGSHTTQDPEISFQFTLLLINFESDVAIDLYGFILVNESGNNYVS